MIIKKTIYLFPIALILFSCKQDKNTGTPDADKQLEVQIPEPRQESAKLDSQFIANDSLTRAWIAELEMISTAEEKFQVENKLTANRHVQNRMDTIKTLTYDESTLKIHTTTDLYALQSAEILDEIFSLQEGLEVGMTKEQLEQVLSEELRSDVIKVGNSTRNMHFTFFFEEDVLERIEFNGYVD